MDNLESIALNLLDPIWLGVAKEYKQKYSLSIWQQFEDNIRSAAYTSNLSKFLNGICQKLGVEFRKQDISKVNEFLKENRDKEILQSLRDETTTLVLIVRVNNEKRREAKKK